MIQHSCSSNTCCRLDKISFCTIWSTVCTVQYIVICLPSWFADVEYILWDLMPHFISLRRSSPSIHTSEYCLSCGVLVRSTQSFKVTLDQTWHAFEFTKNIQAYRNQESRVGFHSDSVVPSMLLNCNSDEIPNNSSSDVESLAGMR